MENRVLAIFRAEVSVVSTLEPQRRARGSIAPLYSSPCHVSREEIEKSWCD
jgi:hypothetical protein